MENSKILFDHTNWETLCKEKLLSKDFCDVTIVSRDETQVEAHRIILSSQSGFFNKMLNANPKRDLLIYLPNLNHQDLSHLLEYIYCGKTEIEKVNVDNFIRNGKYFGLHGFGEENIFMENEKYQTLIAKVDDQGFNRDSTVKKEKKLERHTNGMFSCENCTFESFSRRNVKRHNESVHLGIKYQCQECPNEYTSTSQLGAHISGKHEGTVYQCDLCKKIVDTRKGLRLHIKKAHEGIETKCGECDKIFTSYGQLTYHKKKEHSGKQYPCKQCDYYSVSLANLKVHKKAKHQDTLYSCKICDFQSKWPTTLRTHKKKAHTLGGQVLGD